MTASLELSRKIYELVGEYETDKGWHIFEMGQEAVWPRAMKGQQEHRYYVCPAPDFGEVLRILPKLLDKSVGLYSAKGTYTFMGDIAKLYMDAPTPEAGMEQVEKFLLKLLV